jgi:hypothetical protein
MKAITYKTDEGVAIIYPAYQPEMNQQQQHEFLLMVQNKDVPKLPDGSTIPSWIIEGDQTLQFKWVRSAWKINDNGEIYFDRDKAIEIKKEQFRNLRKPFLEKLDVQFMRALEAGDTASLPQITAKKQELRDITDISFNDYDTPQKLHKFIPDVLLTDSSNVNV